MPPPPYAGMRIRLYVTVPGFRSADAAHEYNWQEKVAVPPGEYLAREVGRNESEWHDSDASDGYYYLIEGDDHSAWVRQNYIVNGTDPDCPFDLLDWEEPLDWNEAWREYWAEFEHED